jgi:hypothetical protein
MTERKQDLADRLRRLAAASKAPNWVSETVLRIAERADEIEPLPDDRASLPEFIYRH